VSARSTGFGFVMMEADMIFQHVETGLLVRVHEATEEIEYQRLDGTVGHVEGGKELTTEAGQRCVPATIHDVHDLISIDVLASGDKVRLVRVG
jgi:hypothetical protein